MDLKSDCKTANINLNNGLTMPVVGLGTFRIRSQEEMDTVIDTALGSGYRLFDTAYVYHNEVMLQNSLNTYLPKHDMEREDIFITTKISPGHHGVFDIVKRAYDCSMHNLGLDYIDMYLIHFPGTQKVANYDKKNYTMRQKTWAGLVTLYESGTVNAIGVSNFTIDHLSQIMRTFQGIVPVVNQVELHPQYPQTDLIAFCKKHDIAIQAYSSLGGTSCENYSLITHPRITQVAEKLEVSCAQVLLRWGLQKGAAIIPKAVKPEHIIENMDLNFTIPDEDMASISHLGKHQIKYAWDPTGIA